MTVAGLQYAHSNIHYHLCHFFTKNTVMERYSSVYLPACCSQCRTGSSSVIKGSEEPLRREVRCLQVKQVQLPDDTLLSITMTWMTENLVQHVSTFHLHGEPHASVFFFFLFCIGCQLTRRSFSVASHVCTHCLSNIITRSPNHLQIWSEPSDCKCIL